MVKKEFSSERLTLQLVAESDHAFVTDIVNSKGWLEFIGDRHVHSEDDARNYIRKILATPDFFYWVVRLKEEQTPIGIVSFIKRNYLDHFDIGFAVLPGFERAGYAFEAASALLAEVGRSKEHSTILATTVPGNVKSIGLLGKLGFEFEREFRVESLTLHLHRISLS